MMGNKGGAGWNQPAIVERWADFDWPLNDLNEVASFYFYVERDEEDCADCEHTGYNPKTKAIADDFYDFANAGRKWSHRITDDEAAKLVEERRAPAGSTAAEINAANAPGARGFGHDAINRFILIEQRARRLGVWGLCPKCDGRGSVFISDTAHLGLVLWMLHPRKGCSRGVEVKALAREDVAKAVAYLAAAAKRNAERFSGVCP
jgi:hypothetical protein